MGFNPRVRIVKLKLRRDLVELKWWLANSGTGCRVISGCCSNVSWLIMGALGVALFYVSY